MQLSGRVLHPETNHERRTKPRIHFQLPAYPAASISGPPATPRTTAGKKPSEEENGRKGMNVVMKCPHCLVNSLSTPTKVQLLDDRLFRWWVYHELCPTCGQAIIYLQQTTKENSFVSDILAYPRFPARAPLPREVPREFADDYKEACVVLADSAKASAALSRRCLQRLLREKVGAKAQNLSDEIEEVLPTLPTHLAAAIDDIRKIGNFAAHPQKSTHSGEIHDVEPGEAEWALDVLEELFDTYFVQPPRLKAKREALTTKLQEQEVEEPPLSATSMAASPASGTLGQVVAERMRQIRDGREPA